MKEYDIVGNISYVCFIASRRICHVYDDTNQLKSMRVIAMFSESISHRHVASFDSYVRRRMKLSSCTHSRR